MTETRSAGDAIEVAARARAAKDEIRARLDERRKLLAEIVGWLRDENTDIDFLDDAAEAPECLSPTSMESAAEAIEDEFGTALDSLADAPAEAGERCGGAPGRPDHIHETPGGGLDHRATCPGCADCRERCGTCGCKDPAYYLTKIKKHLTHDPNDVDAAVLDLGKSLAALEAKEPTP